jgi:hypothetical protein
MSNCKLRRNQSTTQTKTRSQPTIESCLVGRGCDLVYVTYDFPMRSRLLQFFIFLTSIQLSDLHQAGIVKSHPMMTMKAKKVARTKISVKSSSNVAWQRCRSRGTSTRRRLSRPNNKRAYIVVKAQVGHVSEEGSSRRRGQNHDQSYIQSLSDPREVQSILLHSLRQLWGELEPHGSQLTVSLLSTAADEPQFRIECDQQSVSAVRAACTFLSPPSYLLSGNDTVSSTTVYRFDVLRHGTSRVDEVKAIK